MNPTAATEFAGMSTSAQFATVAHAAEERDDYANLLATIRDMTIPRDLSKAADALDLVKTAAAMTLAAHGHLSDAERVARATCARLTAYQEGQRRAARDLAANPNHTPTEANHG
jgi:hypothetical protein